MSQATTPGCEEIINAVQHINQDDIIIAFMGPTGAGKSCFIDLLTNEKGKRVGHSLKSTTKQVQPTRVWRPGYDDRIVLVDTPGFDDTSRPDMVILQIISDWLQKTYSKEVRLSGLVYLHRITDERMAGSSHRNLRMFGELCGDVVMTQVRLVSTMWESREPKVVLEGREQELRNTFWKSFIENGSKVERLKERKAEEAWRIIDQLIEDCKKRDAVLLQEELVELQLRLNETSAGKTVFSSLQKLLFEQKTRLKSLIAEVERQNDERTRKELEKEYAKIDDIFQETFKEAEKMKIPLKRRFMLLVQGKKTRAKGIKVPEVTARPRGM